MALKFTQTSSTAVIYKEPWLALAAGFSVGGATLLVAGAFISIVVLTTASANTAAFTAFGIVFAAAGIALIAQIGAKARSWIAQGKIPVAIATANELTLVPVINAHPKVFAWADIASIALAHQLECIDADGVETHRDQMIVYLAHGTVKSLFTQLSCGVTRSGDGRHCFIIDYPPGKAGEVADALSRFAPGVPIATRSRVLHDKTRKRDA